MRLAPGLLAAALLAAALAPASANATHSPEGKLVYSNGSDVFVCPFPRDGALCLGVDFGAQNLFPTLSPHAERVAYGHNGGIRATDLATLERTDLTATGRDAWPVWSPDGQWIYFHRFREAPDAHIVDVYRVRSDGSGPAEPFQDSDALIQGLPAVLANGNVAAYTTELDGSGGRVEIYSPQGAHVQTTGPVPEGSVSALVPGSLLIVISDGSFAGVWALNPSTGQWDFLDFFPDATLLVRAMITGGWLVKTDDAIYHLRPSGELVKVADVSAKGGDVHEGTETDPTPPPDQSKYDLEIEVPAGPVIHSVDPDDSAKPAAARRIRWGYPRFWVINNGPADAPASLAQLASFGLSFGRVHDFPVPPLGPGEAFSPGLGKLESPRRLTDVLGADDVRKLIRQGPETGDGSARVHRRVGFDSLALCSEDVEVRCDNNRREFEAIMAAASDSEIGRALRRLVGGRATGRGLARRLSSPASTAQRARVPRHMRPTKVEIALLRHQGKLRGFRGFPALEGVGPARAQRRADSAQGEARSAQRRARCLWLRNRKGKFAKSRPNGRVCDRPRWVRAKVRKKANRRGAHRWTFRLRRKLRPGRYVAYSRVTNRAGASEQWFTNRTGERTQFRVTKRGKVRGGPRRG